MKDCERWNADYEIEQRLTVVIDDLRTHLRLFRKNYGVSMTEDIRSAVNELTDIRTYFADKEET